MSIYLLEQLVRKHGLDIQIRFATEAAKLFAPHPTMVAQVSPRGLRLLAEGETQLAEATALLRHHYPEALEIDEPRVRYQDDPEPAEPIMWMIIDTLPIYLSLLRTNLLRRRALLIDCEDPSPTGTPGYIQLCAQAPLAELLGYETELDFLSGGNARLQMGFSHYAPLHSSGPGGAA